MSIHGPSQTRPIRARLVAVLCVAVVGGSLYANLVALTGKRSLAAFIPPFDGRNVSLVGHLGGENLCIATALVAGRGFADPFREPTGPTAWMPPLYPALLALLLKVTGSLARTTVAVVVLQDVALIVTGWVVMDAARRSVDSPRGAAVALAAYLSLVVVHFHSSFQFTHDSWLVLLFMDVLFLAAVRGWNACAAAGPSACWGLLGGISALASPVLGLVWAAATAIGAPATRRALPVLVAAAAAGSVLAPWAVRNYAVFHRLIPVKSNAFYELYQSNVLEPDGVLRFITGKSHPYRAKSAERTRYTAMGEMAYLDDYRARFLAYLRSAPADFVGKVGNRLLAATVFYRPYEVDEEGWTLALSSVLHAIPFQGLLVAWLLGRKPAPPPLRLATAMYVAYLLPYVVVAYYERYAYPLIGLQALACVWGGYAAAEALRRRTNA